ncbi:uncharacterized protein LOC126887019 [Diabrotica virgifera virgifera]|uniref:Protein GVQW3-like n=1 Tax=Diabrotica virgifera virgifera TaxID=50390 RepID=A0ABM5KJ93_DIAVI|nr:uncharacterized protein LOC126887019 [Diabrotica virgifera virgifera]
MGTKKSDKSRKSVTVDLPTFTREQKIIATVWYHERAFTGMSYEELKDNFMIRFKLKYPTRHTLREWDQQLFAEGAPLKKKARLRTSLDRLIYVPYVKESFIRFPDLTVRGRADMLGMSVGTLNNILKNDITEGEVASLKNTTANSTSTPQGDSKSKE